MYLEIYQIRNRIRKERNKLLYVIVASEDPKYRTIKQNILRYFPAVPVGCCVGMERENEENFVILLT